MQFVKSPYFQQRQGYKPELVVIHTMVGTYKGTIGYFQNNDRQVSAHYCVSLTGEITQMVDESVAAHHAGIVSNPKVPLVKSRPNVNPNWYTIGIENADDQNPAGADRSLQYPELIKLVVAICVRHNIPADRNHIVGHRELYDKKTCPGNLDLDYIVAEVKKRVPGGGTMPSDCLLPNTEENRQVWAKLVHNSEVADATVKYLGLADNADNVSVDTVQKSLAARDGKLNSCSTTLSTRDQELATATQEIKNREEQIGRLKADSLQREELLKDDIIKLKKQLENLPVEDGKWQAAYEEEHTKYLAEAKAKGQALNDLAAAKSRIEALEKSIDNDDRATVYKLLRQLLERILGK